jgi:hypothetical protein
VSEHVSIFTSLARVDAADTGRAQPIATFRHLHVTPRPLVLVPLALAGEAAAPLAAMLGTDREHPRLLIVPQPRDRGLRREFFDRLADEVDAYAEEEPQLVVPSRAGVDFLRLLGRSTRFADGDRVGRWLTYFADRAEHPGSSALLAATEALTLHWATGQSSLEDQNLATVIGWIDGEPAVEYTAGPRTDPEFDNRVLGPLIDAYDRGDPAALGALERALGECLEVTWRHVWRALDLLCELPEARSVPERWLWDVAAYAAFTAEPDAPPQPARDGVVAAAARLDRLERAEVRYAAQRALDDPLVMAAHRLAGEAFRCTVVATEPDRKEGRKLRPRITVVARDPVHLGVGETVTSPARRGQNAQIVSISADGVVVLTLTGGMGRGAAPAPGSVPEVGEDVVYTNLSEAFQRPAAFPEQAPWTHGGPGAGEESPRGPSRGAVASAGVDGADDDD